MLPTHRVHVVPWLRPLGGRVLIADWLAITIGRDIWCWRSLDEAELTHELAHVRQWDRYGLRFVARYTRASWRAIRVGGHWYRDNAFEVSARAAASTKATEIAARGTGPTRTTGSAEGRHPGP